MHRYILRAIFAVIIFILSGCSQSDISHLKGTWEPLSRVYDNFGRMTIGDNSILWESGQKISFRVVKKFNKGILVEVTNKTFPKFHGSEYKFIKLIILKDNTAMKWRQLSLSFYESSKPMDDNYEMWGIYVRTLKEK